jgi:hypothetical protein
MIITPLDIPACALWLDGADPSTMYQSISVSRENLFLYPESFYQWNTFNGGAGSNFSVVAVLTSDHVPPDNSYPITNRLSISAASTFDTTLYQTVTLAPCAYTFSVWFKPLTLSAVRLDITRSTTSVPGVQGASCIFDLQTGTVSGSVITYGGVSSSTATITPSAGWYECTLTISNSTTQNYNTQIKLLSTGSLLAYGAQLELSATRTGYFVGATVAPIFSDAITTNLSAVGCWLDKSPRQQVFSNKWIPAWRPVYIPSLSAVRFTGPYLATSSVESLSAQTVFIFGRIFGGNNSLLFAQGAIYPTSNYAAIQSEPMYYTPFYHGGGWNNTWGGQFGSAWWNSQVYTNGRYQIYNATRVRNVVINRVDVANIGATYTGTYMQNIKTNCRVLATGMQENQFADVCEVIVYNRELTPTEKSEVEYYLTRKWSSLNSTIPRYVYATKNGSWSDSTVWSINTEPSPWNVILSSDNVYSNTFTVTANSSTRVSTVQNAALVPNIAAGGSFILSNDVSLSASIIGNGTQYCMLANVPNSNCSLYGSFLQSSALSSTNNNTIYLQGFTFTGAGGPANVLALSSNLIVVNCVLPGNVGGSFRIQLGGSANTSYYLSAINCNVGDYSGFGNSGTLINFINSSPIGYFRNCNFGSSGGGNGWPGKGVWFSSTNGTAYVTNSVLSSYPNTQWSGNSFTINSTNTGYFDNCVLLGGGSANENCCAISNGGLIYITNSSLRGGTAGHAVRNSGTCFISANSLFNGIGGAIINNTGTLSLFASASDLIANNITNAIISTGSLSATVRNIINAPNGYQAIFASRYHVFPGTSATYTRHAVNGYDSYVDYWTSNATFTYPASSDVVLNTTYNNNTLTGSMALPNTSAVFLDCPVGSTTTTIFQVTTGNRYLITSNPLNTNFTLVGASSNTPGTIFTATSAITLSTPITAYNSDTGRVALLGTSTPPTVDSFWNRALSELTLPSNTAGGKLKNVVTTQQLSSIYTGLIYTVPGNF